MIEQYAKANSLSCLLSSNREVEMFAEPFRMQRSVCFRVTYSEYVSYVLSLQPSKTSVMLMTDLPTLRDLAATSNPKLYKFFLKDMAFAILKELSFAEPSRKKATIILPAAFNQNDLTVSKAIQSYENCGNAQNELVRICRMKGVLLPAKISEANADLFKLTVVLYFLATTPNAVTEINFVYDLA